MLLNVVTFYQGWNLKAERNTVSAEIAQAKRNKENADDKIAAANLTRCVSARCRISETMLNWQNLPLLFQTSQLIVFLLVQTTIT